MAKVKEKKETVERKKTLSFVGLISGFTNLLIMASLLFVVYLMYKNPKAINEYLNQQKEEQNIIQDSSDNVELLLSKIADLNSEIGQVSDMIVNQNSRFVEEADILELAKKYEALEKNNLNIIDSKADIKTILEMVNRIDRLESKVSEIAKISDKGALIISAAMLVKERADRGDRFEYEAEILSNLAQKEDRIKDAINTIVVLSHEAIPSNQEILKEFDKMYKNALQVEAIAEEGTWKDRLKAKFDELVQIRKTTEAEVIVQDDKKEYLDQIRADVYSFRFAKALEKIEQYESVDAKEWEKLVRSRLEFDRAISKISAYSLAFMKVNTLN